MFKRFQTGLKYAAVCKRPALLGSNRVVFKSQTPPDVWFTSTLTVLV